MPFHSLKFAILLPAVYSVFLVTADRWRWLVLLVASYCFYAALDAPYLLATLLLVTGISYCCALRIHAQQDEALRRRWLWIGSTSCIGVLVILKYFPFLQSQARGLFPLAGPLHLTVISIGVSYYTFQAVSYLTDVYLELEDAERHFGRYALYLAFFPKLLQGPIERAGDLLPQLKAPYRFNHDQVRAGLLLFAWGLFKKVVIADRLGLMVDGVYNNVHGYSGFSLIAATYLYALQIYFDFSGYTDMALGTARLFDITLTQNFNSPYAATSIADFWRRWHISFSRWILDYIFKPLQMRWRAHRNLGSAAALVVAFLVSGVWHGASWCFVAWGLLHGVYLASSVFYKPLQKKIHQRLGVEKSGLLKIWQVIFTFNIVCFAWIFFRANTFSDALYVVQHLFTGFDGQLRSLLLVSGRISLAILAFSWIIVVASEMIIKRTDLKSNFHAKPLLFRWFVYYGLVALLLVCNIDVDNMFVYFNF